MAYARHLDHCAEEAEHGGGGEHRGRLRGRAHARLQRRGGGGAAGGGGRRDVDHDAHAGRLDRDRDVRRGDARLGRDGRRDPEKIYVFLQHDVDDAPERTEAVLREEERLGLPSCVMIFNRRLDRRLLQDSGEPREKAYVTDDDYLRHLEKKGWIIGYHSNAYEQSAFDKQKAEEILIRDMRELRERFTIEFFCPHGGVRDADGRSNAVLEIPDSLRLSIRWVLNRHIPSRKWRHAGAIGDVQVI